MNRCILCASPIGEGKLCTRCKRSYIYESSIRAARLRKVLPSKGLYKKYNWKSEVRLYNILRKKGGKVYRDLRPEWALSPKGVCLEYDICLPKEKILIELDGPYHHNRSLYKSQEAFEYRQLCDQLKEKYAIDNGWKFYRVNLEEKSVTRKLVTEIIGDKPKRFKMFRRI